MNKIVLLTGVAMLTMNISESLAVTCTWNGTKLTITGSGNEEFTGCSDDSHTTATEVTIGTGVTSIGENAFYKASSLESITIPDSVTSIGEYAFSFSGLTSVTIPDSVTSIGDGAFRYAKSLESVTLPKGLTSIGGRVFQKTSLTNIILPEGITSIGEHAFRTTGLTSITIPEGVTEIGWRAFSDASSLTSITIPDSVTSIGDGAFAALPEDANIICKGDETSCTDTVKALKDGGYTGTISYPTGKTSCEGSGTSLYVWDSNKCGRRNETQCNSVAKYYYSDGKCQVLPKTQATCTGVNIEWNATDKKCVNKNYTPSQADNGDTQSQEGSEFSEADCYNKGQVPYDNKCWNEYPFAKKRWTPAEANQWLRDGNDNFVVLTFKK